MEGKKKRQQTSIETRKLVIKLHCNGKSLREIGAIVGRTHSTIQKIIYNYGNTGTLKNKCGRGRKKILKDKDERYILRQIHQNPRQSVPELTVEVATRIQKPLSTETVRRVLRSNGLNGRVARKKPFISKVNQKKRLEFAKEYVNKPEEFWRNVIFSDECKINLFGSDGKQIVWRKPNTELQKENLCGTVKHGGGSVMVWGCMAASGTGNLVFIDTIMTKDVFLDILKKNLKSSAARLGMPRVYYFQQDNDPKHTAHIVRDWLLYNAPRQLKTPPQSPDINPIENLWWILKQRMKGRASTSKAIFKEQLLEEWDKIGSEVTNKLILSMPRRLQAVIDANGLPTKY